MNLQCSYTPGINRIGAPDPLGGWRSSSGLLLEKEPRTIQYARKQ